MNTERTFVCGTKKVKKVCEGDYRVVCATCDGGGATAYPTKEAAQTQCIKRSGSMCRYCGAR